MRPRRSAISIDRIRQGWAWDRVCGRDPSQAGVAAANPPSDSFVPVLWAIPSLIGLQGLWARGVRSHVKRQSDVIFGE